VADQEQPVGETTATPQSVGFTLSQVGLATSRRFAQIVGALGLEPRHIALLRAVRVADGQSQQAVAERLHIPASTMVALIDQLEQRELLERRSHPSDRRARLLYLTGHGEEVLGKAAGLSAAWENTICAGLSAAEREQLKVLLRHVAVNVGITESELPDHGTGERPNTLTALPWRYDRLCRADRLHATFLLAFRTAGLPGWRVSPEYRPATSSAARRSPPRTSRAAGQEWQAVGERLRRGEIVGLDDRVADQVAGWSLSAVVTDGPARPERAGVHVSVTRVLPAGIALPLIVSACLRA
jgi:DNA-binding MarR family transcriptional regulator